MPALRVGENSEKRRRRGLGGANEGRGYGLRMASDQGIRRLVVEVDSSPVAKWLNMIEKSSGRTRNLMEECIRLIIVRKIRLQTYYQT